MDVIGKRGLRGITLLVAGLFAVAAGAGVRLTATDLAPSPGSADAEPARSAGLVFAPPAGWVGEKPAGGMRLAQGTIPAAVGVMGRAAAHDGGGYGRAVIHRSENELPRSE
jgi:hypothetical protein